MHCTKILIKCTKLVFKKLFYIGTTQKSTDNWQCSTTNIETQLIIFKCQIVFVFSLLFLFLFILNLELRLQDMPVMTLLLISPTSHQWILFSDVYELHVCTKYIILQCLFCLFFDVITLFGESFCLNLKSVYF